MFRYFSFRGPQQRRRNESDIENDTIILFAISNRVFFASFGCCLRKVMLSALVLCCCRERETKQEEFPRRPFVSKQKCFGKHPQRVTADKLRQ